MRFGQPLPTAASRSRSSASSAPSERAIEARTPWFSGMRTSRKVATDAPVWVKRPRGMDRDRGVPSPAPVYVRRRAPARVLSTVATTYPQSRGSSEPTSPTPGHTADRSPPPRLCTTRPRQSVATARARPKPGSQPGEACTVVPPPRRHQGVGARYAAATRNGARRTPPRHTA